MEILITAAAIALAMTIFLGLSKVAKAMREPRPIDPAALVALEEKIAEATARADGLATLNLQLTQKAIEARESIEEMTETLDRESVEEIVTDWMRCEFRIDDHFDKDDFECDLQNQMDAKLEEMNFTAVILTELEGDPELREELAQALAED